MVNDNIEILQNSGYGATELKKTYQKYLQRGLIFAILIHGFIIGTYLFANYISKMEDQKKTDQEKYVAVVYNKTGRKLMLHKVSSEYNKLLLGEKELLLAGNYHCSIVNFAGHEMFKKDFKKRIVNISPTGKRQKYLITYENSTNLSEIY